MSNHQIPVHVGAWKHIHESADLAVKSALRAELLAEDIAWRDATPGEVSAPEDVATLAREIAEMVSWGQDVLIGIEEAGFRVDRAALGLEDAS